MWVSIVMAVMEATMVTVGIAVGDELMHSIVMETYGGDGGDRGHLEMCSVG